MRKLPLSPLIVVIAVSVTSLVDFGFYAAALAVFVGVSGIVPQLDWLGLIPLVLELYIFILGVSMIAATLNARFRDMGAIWDILTRAFFYGSAIFFPVQLLPQWAERLILVNPFGQVMQDARVLILYDQDIVTLPDVLGGPIAYAAPVAITVGLFAFGVLFFRWRQPWFAEGM